MVTPPPPRQTPEVYFRSVQEGGGGALFLALPSATPVAVASIALCVFNIFHISHECRTPKRISPKPEFPKIQQSKNPNPSFGFLETRGICSKSKKTQNSSSFQNSKNPKIPTPVSDFWKLEEFAQNPKKPNIPRVSKIPKIQKLHPKVWTFRNSSGSLEIQKNPKFLKFLKLQKSKNSNPSFGFLETRGICSKSKKTQNSSSFQNSKNPKIPTPLSDFWKLGEFGVFLDFEQIPRVSKNPKLGLGFLDFWIFGNSRNFGFFGF